MITQPTVLVLGAGASLHAKFPSGVQLRRLILERKRGQVDADPANHLSDVGSALVRMGYEIARVEMFQEAFRRSGRRSIDSFLEYRSDLVDVGKAAIAAALIPYERDDTLFPPVPEENWYEYLFAQMAAPWDSWRHNRLAVLTFNYDRSLERFLTTALAHAHGRSAAEAEAMVAELSILHLHGSLGAWRAGQTGFRAYHPGVTETAVRAAAAGIRIVHEQPRREDIPAWKHRVALLQEAERVVFLGFGYDPRNIRHVMDGTAPLDARKEGTVFGMTEREIETVRGTLGTLDCGGPTDEIEPFLRSRPPLGTVRS